MTMLFPLGRSAADLVRCCDDDDDEVNLSSPDKNKLHPLWISGFVDGEGSFHIKMTPHLTNKTG